MSTSNSPAISAGITPAPSPAPLPIPSKSQRRKRRSRAKKSKTSPQGNVTHSASSSSKNSQNTSKVMKQNQYPAYRAPTIAPNSKTIVLNVDPLCKNQPKIDEKATIAYRIDFNKAPIIPTKRALFSPVDVDKYLPKRTKMIFTDSELLKSYFFRLVQEESFISFRFSIARLIEQPSFFRKVAKGNIKDVIKLENFKHRGRSYQPLLFGPVKIINAYPSIIDGGLYFTLSAPHPSDLKFTSPTVSGKVFEARRFWNAQDRVLQQDSLAALLWRESNGAHGVAFVRVLRASHRPGDHSSVILHASNPMRFSLKVICYQDSDRDEIIRVMQYPNAVFALLQIYTHFFVSSEVVLSSLKEGRLLTNKPFSDIEKSLIGVRSARISNPNKDNNVFMDFSSLFKDPISFRKSSDDYERLCNINIGKCSRSSLFEILGDYAAKGKLHVDESQLQGIVSAITQHISLIQGPPGTGKTYIGIQLTKLLLANKKILPASISASVSPAPSFVSASTSTSTALSASSILGRLPICNGPILCICFTNHALDSFLEGLVNAGVSLKGIIRVGYGCESDILKPANINLLGKKEATVKEINKYQEMKVVAREYEETIRDLTKELLEYSDADFVPSFDIVEKHLISLKMNAHAEKLVKRKSADGNNRVNSNGSKAANYEAPFVSSNQISKEKLWKLWVGKAKISSTKELTFPEKIKGNIHVWNYDKKQKSTFLNVIMNQMRQNAKVLLDREMKKYTQHLKEMKEMNEAPQVRALKKAEILGFTTTGAAKYRNVLQKLAPEIIICEEAGEVFEPQVITSLTKKTKHLVLIGDHLQLRPKTKCYPLSIDSKLGYDLDISLFERLIGEEQLYCETHPNTVEELVTLHSQRRMRPMISALLRETKLYPDLIDHSDVTTYPSVLGFRDNLIFFDHQHEESYGALPAEQSGTSRNIDGNDDDSSDVVDDVPILGSDRSVAEQNRSYFNLWEAEMAVSIIQHLIHQGYKGSKDIALLSPYKSQVKLMKRMLEERKVNYHINDLTKEELRLISADEMAMLQMREEAIGSSFEPDAEDNASFQPEVYKFSLESQIHLSTVDNFQGEEANVVVISVVRSNNDSRPGFLKILNRVNVMLSRAKHSMILLGNNSLIEAFMAKKQKNESFFLGDTLKAMKVHGQIKDHLDLKCFHHPHEKMLVKDAEGFKKLSPDGGCFKKCNYVLNCGHNCPRCCHPGDPDHKLIAYECPKKCMKLSCDHGCPRTCGACSRYMKEFWGSSIHPPCDRKCGKFLPCGHPCQLKCHPGSDCLTCELSCSRTCSHSSNPQQCVEASQSACTRPCVWSCTCKQNLKCSLNCSQLCDRLPCDQRCNKRLVSCNHQCPGLCGEKCPINSDYCQDCIVEKQIEENFPKIYNLKENKDITGCNIEEDPLIFLSCGHVFTCSYLDNILGFNSYYLKDNNGSFVSVNTKVEMTIENVKYPECPFCGSLIESNHVFRYARTVKLIRSAILKSAVNLLVAPKVNRLLCYDIQSIQEILLDLFMDILPKCKTEDEIQKVLSVLSLIDLRSVWEKINELEQPIDSCVIETKAEGGAIVIQSLNKMNYYVAYSRASMLDAQKMLASIIQNCMIRKTELTKEKIQSVLDLFKIGEERLTYSHSFITGARLTKLIGQSWLEKSFYMVNKCLTLLAYLQIKYDVFHSNSINDHTDELFLLLKQTASTSKSILKDIENNLHKNGASNERLARIQSVQSSIDERISALSCTINTNRLPN